MANKRGKGGCSDRIPLLGLQNHCDGDCSHEMRRWLLLGWKAMTNLDSVLESIDITLPTKVCIVKAMVFPLVTYGCESWTVKKAEHQRMDAFELWCWRRLLKVHWTARRSNQSMLRKGQPWIFIGRTDAEAEAPIFWLSDANRWLTGKVLILGKIEGRRGHQRTRWLDGIISAMNMNLGKLWAMVRAFLPAQLVKNLPAIGRPGFDPWVGKIPWKRAWQPTPVFWPGESPWTEEPGGLQSMGSQRIGHDWVTEQQQFFQLVKCESFSRVWLFATPFSWPEYWSG